MNPAKASRQSSTICPLLSVVTTKLVAAPDWEIFSGVLQMSSVVCACKGAGAVAAKSMNRRQPTTSKAILVLEIVIESRALERNEQAYCKWQRACSFPFD
jgi:hypothetical protein